MDSKLPLCYRASLETLVERDEGISGEPQPRQGCLPTPVTHSGYRHPLTRKRYNHVLARLRLTPNRHGLPSL